MANFTAPTTSRGTRVSQTKSWGYIDGGPELAAKLANLAKGLRDELLVQVTTAGAEVVAEEWRNRVISSIRLGPGTAHYRDAIGTRAKPGKNGATAWVGLPNELPLAPGESHPRDYAPTLEFRGHPTLRPAYESSKQRALDAMAGVLNDLLTRAANSG